MIKKTDKKISITNITIGVIIFIAGVFFSQYIIENRQSKNNTQDLSLFWEVWSIMEEKYPFEEPENKEKVYSAIEGLVESYDDSYSSFLPPAESEFFAETVSGTFAGIGAEIAIREGYLSIVAPLKDSPAQKYGLLAGDIITHVDGLDITGDTLDEAISKIRGESGTEVILTIYRKGELEPIDINVIRDTVIVPVIETDIIEDVFILHIYNFNENAEEEFKRGIEEFKDSGKKKIIIDVRNNPGGFLTAAIDISSYFLDQGIVVLREELGEGNDELVHRSSGYELLEGINPEVIVLQNGGSASASEIIAGALRDNGIAKVVGEQSYGKGSVQQLIDLPQGTALKVTVAKWLTPNGNQISEVGVEPDMEIKQDYSTPEDIQLQEAIKLFK